MASLSIRSRLSEDLGNAAKSLKTMKLLDKLIERKLEFDKKYQMVNMTELIKENCQVGQILLLFSRYFKHMTHSKT